MTPQDPDDWFSDEPGVADDWREREPAAAPPEHRARFDPRWAYAIAAALVLVVAGLAIGGVFTGGGKKHPTTATTTTTPATTRPATTTAPTPPAVTAPAAPLKPGDTGTQVKQLQKALEKAGHSPGTIDGNYGPSTQAAVKELQTASNLTADGVYGPATATALKKALQQQS